MLADLLALAVIAACALHGFIRGLTASLLGILGMAGAVLAAWLFCGPASRCLKALFGLPLLPAYVLGGLFIYIVTFAAFAALLYLVRRRNKARKPPPAGKPPYPWRDKLWGAGLGVCVGAIMAASLVLLYNLTCLTPVGARWPDIRNTVAGRLAGLIIHPEAYLLARAMTGDPAMSRTLTRTMTNPRAAVEDAQSISRNPEVTALLQDPRFSDAVLKADPEAIKNNRQLNRLLSDPDFIRSATNLGLLPADSDSASLREQAAEELARAGRKMAQIRADPEVQDLTRDGAIRKMLDEGDLGRLVRDERTQKLAVRVMQIVRTEQQ